MGGLGAHCFEDYETLKMFVEEPSTYKDDFLPFLLLEKEGGFWNFGRFGFMVIFLLCFSPLEKAGVWVYYFFFCCFLCFCWCMYSSRIKASHSKVIKVNACAVHVNGRRPYLLYVYIYIYLLYIYIYTNSCTCRHSHTHKEKTIYLHRI